MRRLCGRESPSESRVLSFRRAIHMQWIALGVCCGLMQTGELHVLFEGEIVVEVVVQVEVEVIVGIGTG